MNITLLSVDVKTKTSPKSGKPYQVAEVAYKNNTFQGKVEGKQVMAFGPSANSFKTLAEALSGESYEVTVVKNDAGFNDWTQMARAEAGATSPSAATAPTTSSVKGATASTKTTYETPEERAQRQVLIVRQSSVSSAVSMLCAGAKTPPSLEVVLATAKAFEAYVFGQDSPAADFGEEFPTVD